MLRILGECIEYFFFSVYVGCFTKFKFRGGEVKQGYVVMVFITISISCS